MIYINCMIQWLKYDKMGTDKFPLSNCQWFAVEGSYGNDGIEWKLTSFTISLILDSGAQVKNCWGSGWPVETKWIG